MHIQLNWEAIKPLDKSVLNNISYLKIELNSTENQELIFTETFVIRPQWNSGVLTFTVFDHMTP